MTVCGVAACDDRIRNGAETGTDCGGPCDPCPPGEGCTGPGDCVEDVCVAGTCQPPACDDNVPNGSETEADCGGPDCPACNDGAVCALPRDCASNQCIEGRCIAATCDDGRRNGGETDTDCGGPACPSCPAGGACGEDGDCATDLCRGGRCVEPSCDDGEQNGGETGRDCGGPDCAKCGAGQGCDGGDDCASRVCSGGTCSAPACDDAVQNGDERGVDCGGACPDCGPGEAGYVWNDLDPEDALTMAPPGGLVLSRLNVSYAPDGSVYIGGEIRNDGDQTYCFVTVEDIDVRFVVVGDGGGSARAFVDGVVRRRNYGPGDCIVTNTCLPPGATAVFLDEQDRMQDETRAVSDISLRIDAFVGPDYGAPSGEVSVSGLSSEPSEIFENRSALVFDVRNRSVERLVGVWPRVYVRGPEGQVLDSNFATQQDLAAFSSAEFRSSDFPVAELPVRSMDVRVEWEEACD
ncbi:MAG: hypothetical protein ACYTF3_11750 [Planctomycetota bacterium]|jgi:hypothetical protein